MESGCWRHFKAHSGDELVQKTVVHVDVMSRNRQNNGLIVPALKPHTLEMMNAEVK